MRVFRVFIILWAAFAASCALLETEAPKKPTSTGLIATPPSYYSTAKARYLGTKYKDNLDRLVERIVRNPKTSNLQFANNISSVGGVGFFTHSAAKSPDERYLEVVLGTSETFETKGSYSEKVARLFSVYGMELLAMMSSDADIYQDKELSGYGLNLAWRNVAQEATGSRVSMERAIVYFPKERVRSFLRREFNQNELLSNAVIFAVEEDGPLQLVSYRPQEIRPDFRPAIREDNLAAATPSPAPALLGEPSQRAEENIGKDRLDSSTVQESVPTSVTSPSAVDVPAKAQVPVVAEPKRVVAAPKSDNSPALPAARAKPVAPITRNDPAAKESADIVGNATPQPIENAQEASHEPSRSTVSAPAMVVEKPESVEVKPRETVISAVEVSRTTEWSEKAAKTALPVPTPKISEAAKSAPVPSGAKVEPAKITPELESPPRAPKIAVEPLEKQSVEIKSLKAAVSPAQPVIVTRAPKAAEISLPASPPPTKITDASPNVVQRPVEIPASAPAVRVAEPAKSAPLPSVAKVEPAVVAPMPPAPVISPTPREATGEKTGGDQIALLKNKPIESLPERKPLVRPVPRVLEGFVVQLAFNDKEKARSWAEAMEKRGYAVSITEAGAEGALRVRLGNFAQRDEAERQLRNFKQEGLNGIIINLPQGFRPVARSSIP
jgi:DedD protein